MYDVITIGSSQRDMLFYSDQLLVVDNPSGDPTTKQILGAEFGAKIRSDNVQLAFGGGAANSAVNFSGMGLRVALATAVGADATGKDMRTYFRSRGVDTRMMIRMRGLQTGFSFVPVDTKTGEHSAYSYYGAASHITAKAIASRKTRWFYVTSIPGNNWEDILDTVAAGSAKWAWNPGGPQLIVGYSGLERFFPAADVLLLNRDEAIGLLQSHPDTPKADTMQSLLEVVHHWGSRIVVITDGRNGSMVYDGNNFYTQQVDEDPVDTTGAGDCFGSSFLTGLIRYNGDIQRAHALATYAASQLVKQVGAQHGLVSWNNLPDEFHLV